MSFVLIGDNSNAYRLSRFTRPPMPVHALLHHQCCRLARYATRSIHDGDGVGCRIARANIFHIETVRPMLGAEAEKAQLFFQ
jgi:phage gp36-like protein